MTALGNELKFMVRGEFSFEIHFGKWKLFKKEPIMAFDKLVVRSISSLGSIIVRAHVHVWSNAHLLVELFLLFPQPVQQRFFTLSPNILISFEFLLKQNSGVAGIAPMAFQSRVGNANWLTTSMAQESRNVQFSFSFMARTHPQSLRQESSGRLWGH